MCRILAIAPYESMRNLIVNLCADRPEIQLTALVGDLEEGAKLVNACRKELDTAEQKVVKLSKGPDDAPVENDFAAED